MGWKYPFNRFSLMGLLLESTHIGYVVLECIAKFGSELKKKEKEDEEEAEEEKRMMLMYN